MQSQQHKWHAWLHQVVRHKGGASTVEWIALLVIGLVALGLAVFTLNQNRQVGEGVGAQMECDSETVAIDGEASDCDQVEAEAVADTAEAEEVLMKIIAHQEHRVYLLDIGNELGQVLDLDQNMLFQPFNIHSLLTYSPWETYTGSQEILADLLEQVTVQPPPPPPKRRSAAEIQPPSQRRSAAEIEQWLRDRGFHSRPPASTTDDADST